MEAAANTSSEVLCYPVEPGLLPRVWKQVGPSVERFCKQHGGYEPPDIVEALLAREMMLWHVTGDGVNATILTEVLVYPRMKVGFVLWTEGEDMHKWQDIADSAIIGWGKALGCSEFHWVGRPGWKKHYGKPYAHVYRRRV